MNQQERSTLLKSLGKFIQSRFATFERRLESAEQKAAQALALDIDARIKLATLEAVKSAEESMRAELSQTKQEAIEATKRANDLAASLRQPEDGKSVTADDVLPMLEDLVARRFAEVPAPAGPDPEFIRGMVQEAVEALPKPEGGKDADPEQIKQAVAAEVAKIPAPQDGKSVTLDDVMPMLNLAMEEVHDRVGRRLKDISEAIAAVNQATNLATEKANTLRQPEDGKSITLDDVMPLIDDAVTQLRADADVLFKDTLQQAQALRDNLAKSLAELRQPEDGKSFTAEDAKPFIDRAVADIAARLEERIAVAVDNAQKVAQEAAEKAASLRQPEDGRSITLDEVRPVIEEAIKREVDAIPRPMDGKSVTLDDVRPLVDEAVKSAVAAIEVPEPRDGEDGRDALQLEILPIIDPDKSYPRGSYAKHLGGLWRAYEQTHGMRGWECIVEGIATLSVEQIGERTFVIDCGLSSGRAVRKEVAVPMVIDRGVYRADGEYKAGDGVTWAGSYWIAKDDTPQGKPGEPGSDGWRLAVKRGRDGKDGRNGINKTAPVRVEK